VQTVAVQKSLAVKYRPRRLDGVIGQAPAIAALKGMLKAKTSGQAFLISGPSGTGKTTTARILAHYLNCEDFNFQKTEPCFTCAYCEQVKLGRYPDVEEFNISDSRGIDTIRGIIDDLQYEGRTNAKVYILDEMHQMTKQAANALLKPLEEPPENAVFILLTTEPQNVLNTIRNRCTQITLQRVPDGLLFSYLGKVVEREKRQIPEEALKYLAQLCYGDVRLALSKLECLFFALDSDSSLDLTDTANLLTLLGTRKEDDAASLALFLLALYSGSYAAATKELTLLLKDKVGMKWFFERLYDYHRVTFHHLLKIPPHSDFYQSWESTLNKEGTSVNFRLTPVSAAKVSEYLIEAVEKLKEYVWDEDRTATYYTLKMIEAVRTEAVKKRLNEQTA